MASGIPSPVVDRSRVIWNELEGETLVIDTETGVYYSLDEVGGAIWKLLAHGRGEDDIVAHILSEYEVDEALARADVRRLTERMREERLISAGGPEEQ